MIDLHTHILPGLDDGSDGMDDSLAMVELALESGVDTIVATPHSNQVGRFENYDSPGLQAAFREMKRAIREEGFSLKLLLGMEIMTSDDIREKIEDHRLIGINGTDYYLVEFPFDSDPYWMEEKLGEILEKGKIPLIAHPERYFCVQEYPGFLYEWLQMGCFSQANKGSLFGKFGRHAQQTLEVLMENYLVTCIASDAHSPYMRTTFMRDAREYLEERYGSDAAYYMLMMYPEMIINGKKIHVHGRIPQRKRHYFL